MRLINRSITFLITAIVLAAAPVADAQSRSSNKIREQQRQKQQQIKDADRKLKANTAETEQRLNQLELVDGQIAVCNKKIRRQRSHVDSLNRNIKQVSDSIAVLDSRVTLMKEKYATALRQMQVRKSSMGDLAFLFASESFAQAYRRYRSLQQFARWRERKADEIVVMRGELETKQSQLEKLKQSSAAALASLAAQRKELEQRQEENNRLVAQLKKEGGKLKKILERRRQEADALDKELDRVIAEEIRKQREEEARKEAERRQREEEERQRLLAEQKAREEAAKAAEAAQQPTASNSKDKNKDKAKDKPTGKVKDKPNGRQQGAVKNDKTVAQSQSQPAKKPTQTAPSQSKSRQMPELTGSFESNKGKLPFPVEGDYTIVKKFGRQRHPKLPKVETNNSGIDVETTRGAGVRAVFDGEVSQIFRLNGYNNVVVIRHGEYVTVYANLEGLSVRKGDIVKCGQTIGNVFVDAADGNRSVLHFEVRRETEKRNPEEWVAVK